jgi:hypothetical protein
MSSLKMTATSAGAGGRKQSKKRPAHVQRFGGKAARETVPSRCCLVADVGSILLILTGDVVLEPILQEYHQFHRQARLVGNESLLEIENPSCELIVHNLVRFGIRVSMLAHELLFMCEMNLGILHEAGKRHLENGFAFAVRHGTVQLGSQRKKPLVLIVNTVNLDAVFGLPFKHVNYPLGRFGRKL